MRDNYDFSNAVNNPYAEKLKQKISIRLDQGTVEYFKDLANETGLKYQQLINLYLTDCAKSHKKISIDWK
ncbi:BrnA antitoxin family protein [Oceanispirochaeta sp. M1]|uniref:CopG family antitoxin n=1 Tax=Oceanispirochaeta sp. M1 TaxID=2283433 RepID=UPI000E097B8D|nr:BrnA antitoxin family protein [Oceanispirochaeta sp. M1]NPD75313.1 antitoxin [Oceanispirochaeta sp. M1]RDG28836.1 antitoxin [Oceanispirochaeta sp. M1]